MAEQSMYRYTIGEQTPKGSIAGGGEMHVPVMIDNRLSITYDQLDIEEVDISQTLTHLDGNSPMKLKKRRMSPRAESMKNKDEEFVMFNDFPIKFGTRHRNKAAYVEESVQAN